MSIQQDRDTLTVAVHRVVIVHVKDIQPYRTTAWSCRSSSLFGLFDRIGIIPFGTGDVLKRHLEFDMI